MRAGHPAGSLLALLLILISCNCLARARDDSKALIEGLQEVGACVIRGSFSFLYPEAYPPRNEQEMRATCRNQTEAFKCLRERTRGSAALIRRGMLTYVNSRTKHHRTYCANVSSEPTRKLIEACKCLREKRLLQYRANEVEFLEIMEEIVRRNFSDPSAELKQICCAVYNNKLNMTKLAGMECAAHKEMIEDLVSAMITDDITIVCDDDDKLARVCPQLESLQFKRNPKRRFDLNKGMVAPSITIFLVATLGEPNDVSTLLD